LSFDHIDYLSSDVEKLNKSYDRQWTLRILFPHILQHRVGTFTGWCNTMRTTFAHQTDGPEDVPLNMDPIKFLYVEYPQKVAQFLDFLCEHVPPDSGFREDMDSLPLHKKEDLDWWKKHVASLLPKRALSPDREQVPAQAHFLEDIEGPEEVATTGRTEATEANEEPKQKKARTSESDEVIIKIVFGALGAETKCFVQISKRRTQKHTKQLLKRLEVTWVALVL